MLPEDQLEVSEARSIPIERQGSGWVGSEPDGRGSVGWVGGGDGGEEGAAVPTPPGRRSRTLGSIPSRLKPSHTYTTGLTMNPESTAGISTAGFFGSRIVRRPT